MASKTGKRSIIAPGVVVVLGDDGRGQGAAAGEVDLRVHEAHQRHGFLDTKGGTHAVSEN